MLEPTGFLYVMHSKCGHINAMAVEPHVDDKEERASLMEWLQPYILNGGWISRHHRSELTSIKIDMCQCPENVEKVP